MSAADDGSKDRIAEFTEFRQRMNQRILGEPNQVVRRFFALDTQTYQAGALDVKTKELLGLVADGAALRRLHQLPRGPVQGRRGDP